MKFILSTAVTDIAKRNGRFIINNKSFDKVVVATGGKSQENLGSNGSGYALLQKFGHTLTKTIPAITQIKTKTDFVKQLKGLKINANCKILVDDKLIRKEYGQLLFADYGLSGPPIFSLSRIASEYESRCSISLDLLPDYSFNQVVEMIESISNDKFNKWVCFDISPAENNKVPECEVVKRDTIKDFPKGYKVAITNPPYLAKNSATRRELEYLGDPYDDLYKKALEVMLK